jgi:hypothetical protein
MLGDMLGGGKLLGKYGDDFAKFAKKYGDEILKYADDAVEYVYKYADDVLERVFKNGDEIAEITTKYSDEGVDFISTADGVLIPTNPDSLKDNLNKLEDVSGVVDDSSATRKFTGSDSDGPIRTRIEKSHGNNPDYTGPTNPDHNVDHLHIDRRKNGETGSWKKQSTVPYSWPF